MSKLDGEARKEVIQKANQLIVETTTAEGRKNIFDVISRLLIACDSYRGFNYLYWMEKGFTEWREAGSPENNIRFLGDQTMIKFY
jgi:hypothetical protein